MLPIIMLRITFTEGRVTLKMQLPLSAEGIDRVCEQAQGFLAKTGMTEREALAGRLSIENVLVMWNHHYGDDTPVTVRMGNMLGKPGILVAVRGERFDPRTKTTTATKYAPIARRMMEESGFVPAYAYRGGHNIITLTRPRPPMSSLTQILIAFVLGLVVALAGNALIPEAGRTYALEKLITPLFDLFLGMLSGLAGPLIFFTVAWGVCGIGDVAILGRSGKSLVGRFLRDNVLATVFACLACILFFALPAQGGQGEGDFFGDVVKMIIDLIPTNIVKAFADGNTSQIIILSIFVGIAALVLGESCEWLRKGIQELSSLMQFLMEQLCRLIPAFIFIMVLSQVWSGTFSSLFSMWVPLLLAVVLIVAFFAARAVYTSVRFHVPLTKLLSSMRPSVTLGLTTASSCAALGSMVTGCTEELGIDEEQTSLGIPLGMILCQPPTIIMLVVLVMHCMQTHGLGADVTWYVRMALMCFLYSMVSPPVPGGMLVCIGLLFGRLGIPAEALAMATAFNIITDYVLTGFRVGHIMLDVFDTASVLGNVDRSKLGRTEAKDVTCDSEG